MADAKNKKRCKSMIYNVSIFSFSAQVGAFSNHFLEDLERLTSIVAT